MYIGEAVHAVETIVPVLPEHRLVMTTVGFTTQAATADIAMVVLAAQFGK